MRKILLATIALLAVMALAAFVGARLLMNPERVRAAVEAQAAAALGLPVTIGAADVQLWPRAGLTIANMTVGEPTQLTIARAQLSTGLLALLSRRIEDGEVVIEDSRLDLLKLLGALSGLAGSASNAAAGGPAEASALTIASIRTIGLRNVDLIVGDRHANVTLESALLGDRLEIHRLSAKAAATTLEATGAVDSIATRTARLKIDADPLDLDGLMQFAGALSQAPTFDATQASGRVAAMDLRAEVTAPSGRVAGLTFANLQTTIAVTPDGITLSPLSFSALAGRFEGIVSVALGQGEPALGVSGAVSGVNLQQLAEFGSGQPSGITGTLNATLKLNGRGLDPDSALKTATGSADVQLLQGRIPGLQLVRPAVLAFGRPQGAPPEGEGEAFERISATVAIDRGQLRTNNLVFASRDVDVDGTGHLVLGGGALDVKGDLKLSEELSAQAGRDLVRYARDGNRVVLPAVVSGTIASPFVMIDMQRAARRALTNEIQNRAGEAFKRLIPGGLGKKPPRQ